WLASIMVMASCVAVLFGDKIRSQSKPFLYLFQLVAAKDPVHDGDIVVASVQGEFTVKRLLLTPRLTLQPMNAAWSPIYPDPDDLDIFGVVTHIIHRPREMY
ncbi:S24 family peptidase, partial [Klebsiella quasipneumoniae subsp. similipneumoniae]|uniref:S24 family peptidase n=1 Tax=Klebsiella quasipneumoniae TaxID=1463165 RepID=UPI003BF6C7D2